MRRIPSGVTDQVLYFVAVDATDLKTRETGLSSFTVVRSRNGAADATFTTPTVAEVDNSTMPGVYTILLDEDMTIGSGNDSEEVCLHITQASMAPVTLVYELYRREVTAGETLTVTSGLASANATQISGSSTAADNVEVVFATDFATNYDTTLDRWQVDVDSISADTTAAATLELFVEALDQATGQIDSGSFAAGAIDAAAIANGAIDAATFAADVDAEFLSYIVDDATRIDASALNTATGTTIPTNLNATVSSRASAADLATVAGYLDTEIAAILADTNELQTDWADGGRLDLILDARASQTSVDDLPTNAELATALGTADDAVLSALSALETHGDSTWATATGFSTHAAADVWSVGTRVLTASTNLGDLDDAILAILGTPSVTIADDIAGISAGSGPTASEIADEVQTRTIAAVTTVNGLAANTVNASALAADAVSEIQSGLATASAVADLPTNSELATALAGADDAVLAAIAALNNISVADVLTTQMTESYAGDGVAPTLTQALLLIHQKLSDFAISGTTLAVKKLDGTTDAATFTLDDGTTPTALARTG